jgi:beta-lactamase regulating signal transducer with metallopeptidase domain
MKKYIPSPIDIYVAFVGIALSVFCAAVPNFPIHITGIILLMACNDLGSFTINSLQGTINSEKAYKKVGPLGQVVRRSMNVITAVTGPRLYSIMPQLPYLIAGSITLVWAVLIMIVLSKRTKANQQEVMDKVVFSAGTVNVDKRTETTLRQMSFGRLEMLSSTVKDWSRRRLFIDK